ncbi:Transmembrane protein [Quillaja saponaria]|uniref:Transmembrane protein n=1 Tax=Quillaja saponaria TaxID=32244 RepID=A0AAD7Q463_QUISA|nr:Transmembrane protein [Quillaja saponaria]KAJ7974547.1 Transmembrane protein [Quillaja saponaria]
MENNQRKMKEKLGLFQIFKESVQIPLRNPNFIIFIFLTSLPLFCFLFMYEKFYQRTILETVKISQEVRETECTFCYDWKTLQLIQRVIEEVSYKFLLLLISYLGIFHFLDLFNAIATVNSASVIYKGDKDLNLKEMFCRHLMQTRFKGPLITGIYVLLLTSLVSMGLVCQATYIYFTVFSPFFTIIYLVWLIALLTKYLEWSAVWNMGIVISLLEEKEGDVALVISENLGRGSRHCGTLLMFAYSVWRFSLTLICLYLRYSGEGNEILITTVHISMVCLANVLKWVAFVVYFYDCKKRISEKEISIEGGQDMTV